MNSSVLYLTVTIWAGSGLWVLWQFGFRHLFLDEFRDALFAYRDNLYEIAQQGRIDCDSDAYRALELLISGVIRYAHRFTFTSLVLSRIEREAEKDDPQPAFPDEIFSKIDRIADPSVRDEMRAIAVRVGFQIQKYAAKSSLPLMVLAALYHVVKIFRPVFASEKKSAAISDLQRGAYVAAKSEAYVHA